MRGMGKRSLPVWGTPRLRCHGDSIPDPGMHNRLVIVVLFLVAGSIVNVAVAWLIAWRTGPIPPAAGPPRQIEAEKVTALWRRHARPGWPELPGGATLRRVYGRSSLTVHPPAEEPRVIDRTGETPVFVTRHEVGLPMRSLASVSITWLEAGDARADNPGGWVLRSPLRIVPYVPRLPGFAVNAAFYALLLWLLSHGPAVVRRHRRRRRGLCESCGYPCGDGAVCPECGHQVGAR